MPIAQAESSSLPILVVVNDRQEYKWGRYLGEILRAEGLNSYDLIDINGMSAARLSAYPLVILAQTALTDPQAATFREYVKAGGRLIAMRPDPQMIGLFGLGASAGRQTDGYLGLVQGAGLDGTGLASGLTGEKLQIHGAVDLYPPAAGATVLAQVYSDATTATSYPAVVSANSGTGKAIAYLYDLPGNIIYTRQGDPGNSSFVNPVTKVSGDVDGDGMFRTIDLFEPVDEGSAAWVDLDKVPIPQADVQMRYFARLVKRLVGEVQPQPALWYFPGSAMTMLVMTGDGHANPESYYQAEIDSLLAHHGRITFYDANGVTPTPSEALAWMSSGITNGIHPYASQINPKNPGSNIENLQDGYLKYFAWFQRQYALAGVTMSKTVRNHQVAWAGWTDSADYAARYGIGMDTSFYSWGRWLRSQDGTWAHGYVTGSGQPMKFIRMDGSILPVYQQLTELIDEQLLGAISPTNEKLDAGGALDVTKQIIDASLRGNYSALMTQNHVDYYGFGSPQAWAEGMLDYAYSKGVPIWNADQWYNFTQVRHDANLDNLSWNPVKQQLSFNLTASPASWSILTIVLPQQYNNEPLDAVSVDGVPMPVNTTFVSGEPMVFVSTPAGYHAIVVDYLPKVNLSITQTAAPESVAVGGKVTYALTIQNNGIEPASGAVFTDILPAGMAFLGFQASSGWNCESVDGKVTCRFNGKIALSAPETVQIFAKAPDIEGWVSNTGVLNSPPLDTRGENNTSDTTSIRVKSMAALDLKIDSSPDVPAPGEQITYTLRVTNLGPNDATYVDVLDRLPPGSQWVLGGGPGWTCSQARGLAICIASRLAVGEAPPVQIVVKAPVEAGVVQNSAQVNSYQTGNNNPWQDSIISTAARP